MRVEAVWRDNESAVGAQGTGTVAPIVVLHAILVDRRLTPEAAEVDECGHVAARTEALGARAREREVPPDPRVTHRAVIGCSHGLAGVRGRGRLRALLVRAYADAAHLARVARHAELHARVAVGRFGVEFRRQPAVTTGQVVLQRIHQRPPPSIQLDARPEQSNNDGRYEDPLKGLHFVFLKG